MIRNKQGYTILVPVGEATPVGPLIEMASALVPLPAPGEESTTGRVVVLRVVEVPPDLAMAAAAAPARLVRQSLGRLKRFKWPPHVELRSAVRVSRESWAAVVAAAYEEDADLILIPWQEWTSSSGPGEGAKGWVEQVVQDAPCDVAIARPAPIASIRRVLVPVRGGPHAALAVRLATALAERSDATVTALRVNRAGLGASEQRRERAEYAAVLKVAPSESRNRLKSRTIRASGTDLASLLVEQTRQHQLLVMGATAGAPGTPLVLGPVAEALVEGTTGGVVVVRTRLPGDVTHEQWGPLFAIGGEAVPGRRRATVSEIVDKWFAENTFDSSEFERLDDLVDLKRKQGVRISVGLPALNEEETVGAIIRSIKTELCERFPLIDELVLIDSQSTDRTREIARELGIPVVIHQEVLPSVGSVPGKGEALWKSLQVLQGDIVAWIDTDIRNIHPRFVYGLLGPLLREPRIQYVKGFYKRPIKAGNRIQSTGGGRVTELLARPLVNTFYPELSGLIQPLAGEYAGRREALEQLPFFTGYGVEIGLLIDLLDRFGLQAIGQVDLKRRVHRNQALPSLSRMAFTILQVVLRRQEQRGHLDLARELASSMKLIHHDRDGFHVEERELVDVERPPIRTLADYKRAREAYTAQKPKV